MLPAPSNANREMGARSDSSVRFHVLPPSVDVSMVPDVWQSPPVARHATRAEAAAMRRLVGITSGSAFDDGVDFGEGEELVAEGDCSGSGLLADGVAVDVVAAVLGATGSAAISGSGR